MLYPIFVNLQQRRCVVIGAGPVAEKRIKSLLEHGALVEVIAPEATDNIRELSRTGKIVWNVEKYSSSLLDGVFLVIAATSSYEINNAVARDANLRNQLICRADSGDDGNYVTPATIRRGELQIAVTTSGASPSLTSALKSQLESIYGVEWETWTQIFSDVRTAIHTIGTETARRTVVNEILKDESIGALVKNGLVSEAKRAALKCISSHSD